MRSYEEVKKIFEDNGCELLEKTYKNNKTKMRYKAQCGHEHTITMDNFIHGKGRLCPKCSARNRSEVYRYSYEYVKGFFEKEGCKLLSKDYKSANHQKLEYIAQCGHKNKMSFTKFKAGGGRVCAKCSKSVKYEYDYVVETFFNKDCVLLEDKYINCKKKMRYIAQCGHEATITFDKFQNAENMSLRCERCQQVTHYSYEDVKKVFEENGCKLVSTKYIKGSYKLEYIARCGHKTRITFYKFLAGQGRFCPKCAMPKGEKHHAYNPNLIDEDRKRRDMQNGDNKKLREKAYKRDNYTCQICGDKKGGNLVAHHLDAWNKFESERFNLNNVITLCEKCHNEFHKKYGYGDNTKKQFDEFVKNKKK